MFGILKDKLKKAVESISKKIEEKEEVIEEEKPEEKGLFKKVVEKVVKKISVKKLSEEDLEPILGEIESDLIEADVAYEVAEKIKDDLKETLISKEIKRGKEKEVVVNILKESLLGILSIPEIDLEKIITNKKPTVLVFLGFNGSGKTTSLAKLGKYLIDNGYSCVFAAADTFRAASLEQLEEHAKKIGINVIKHKYGADPAAVIFDAIEHAKAKGIDFVIADTAGRSHTNVNLIDQLKKICKVNKPDLKILVLDSLTGNDILPQCQFFNDAVGVDTIIFTKMDVNEKGGAILSVTHELKKPILFLGLGQKYEEFEKFNAKLFIDNLLKV